MLQMKKIRPRDIIWFAKATQIINGRAENLAVS